MLSAKRAPDEPDPNSTPSPSVENFLLRKMPRAGKPAAWDFYSNILGSPKHVLAPMIDQSELAWRMLGRRHDVHLAFTPMINAKIFNGPNLTYRRHNWQTCAEDRPLIVQVAGHDAREVVKVGMHVQDACDAVDLNLGCPQLIAKRGHYGAFLQDEWLLIASIVKAMDESLSIPITCKIRIFPEVQRTVEYARMLVAAGAKMLTVHGRTRDQKGTLTGLADWPQIKAVVEAVDVPVISNGNILCLEDVSKCMEETGAVGVMSAEGHLYNPAIFASHQPPRVVDMVREYWSLVDLYPTPVSWIRGHLFKMLRACLSFSNAKDENIAFYEPYRQKLGLAKTQAELRSLSEEICAKLESDESEKKSNSLDAESYWLCIPYVRHKTAQKELSKEQ